MIMIKPGRKALQQYGRWICCILTSMVSNCKPGWCHRTRLQYQTLGTTSNRIDAQHHIQSVIWCWSHIWSISSNQSIVASFSVMKYHFLTAIWQWSDDGAMHVYSIHIITDYRQWKCHRSLLVQDVGEHHSYMLYHYFMQQVICLKAVCCHV